MLCSWHFGQTFYRIVKAKSFDNTCLLNKNNKKKRKKKEQKKIEIKSQRALDQPIASLRQTKPA